MADTTIVICYRSGTANMLRVCLSSIKRHTLADYHVVVVCHGSEDTFDAGDLLGICDADVKFLDINSLAANPSHAHGKMLDAVIPSCIETKYVMSLDSDCFPVASGWLMTLRGMLEEGAGCAGILYPYAPPSSSLRVSSVEFRVRIQQCWLNTHVACQMLAVDSFGEHPGMRYGGGDDTGLLIPAMTRNADARVEGYRATRSPKAALGMDEEFNRYMSIVFGDAVYHHGGFTRGPGVFESEFGNQFGWVEKRLFDEEGAEFLLDDANSYLLRYDKEDDVARQKMSMLFGLRSER